MTNKERQQSVQTVSGLPKPTCMRVCSCTMYIRRYEDIWTRFKAQVSGLTARDGYRIW